MRRIFLIAAVFLSLSLLLSSAGAYYIDKHLVQINIADDGTAKVNEKFFLIFRNATDLVSFRQKAQENGPSPEVWGAFDGNITPHVDSIKGGTGRIIFEEKQSERYVSIEYETAGRFMAKKSETSRQINWEISPSALGSFETGSIYSIPGNTDISILLPKNAILKEEIIPTGIVSGNIVSWSGPINFSGNIVLKYTTEKQIASGIRLSKTMQEIVSSGAMPTILAVLIAVLVVIYTLRKRISKKIEKYVVEHSQIEAKPGHEEDELE